MYRRVFNLLNNSSERVFGYDKIKCILVNKVPHFSSHFVREGTQNYILSLLLGNPQSICFLTASCGRKHFILSGFKHYALLKFHFHRG